MTKSDRKTVLLGSHRPGIYAILLAAGSSQRMGKQNKLLITINGTPMLRRVAETILSSDVESLTVVTGFQESLTVKLLNDLPITFAHNLNFKQGLSTSLSTGLRAMPKGALGVIICLGDMPMVRTEHINKLIASFDPSVGKEICVLKTEGKQGNPVLLGKRFFSEIIKNTGDVGAKDLIKRYSHYVTEVYIEDDAVLFDIDTPSQMDYFLNIKNGSDANDC